MKSIQPDILVNNRLGLSEEEKLHADGGGGSGDSEVLGDFGSPSMSSSRIRSVCGNPTR